MLGLELKHKEYKGIVQVSDLSQVYCDFNFSTACLIKLRLMKISKSGHWAVRHGVMRGISKF